MARNDSTVSRMPERRSGRDIPVRGAGVSSLRNEINRLFDRFSGRGMASRTGRRAAEPWGLDDPWLGRDPFELLDSAFGAAAASFGHADLSETDEGYELQIDLPGMKNDGVAVDYSDGILTVSGERSDEREDRRKGYYLSERSYGVYERSFRVPDSVEPDDIGAEFRDGVLTVTLPKSEEARRSSRRIDVREG